MIALLVLQLAGADPRALFEEGKFVAAGAAFEQRWQKKNDLHDGVNAVVAWRSAAHYAHARVLLGRVVSRDPPSGQVAERVALLESKLATLTATVALEDAGPSAIVEVDALPADRLGPLAVVDVGAHDIVVRRQNCDPFRWSGVAHPGERITLKVSSHCAPPPGVLHVRLIGEPGASFSVDGTPYTAPHEDRSVTLPPGTHRMVVASRARPVTDESVHIESGHTTEAQVAFPWRARSGGWTVALPTMAARSTVGVIGGGGLAFGRSGSWYSALIYAGTGRADLPALPNWHPWAGMEGIIHLLRRPLWAHQRGSMLLTFDFDPIAVRFDQLRTTSYFGINASLETVMTMTSFLPATLTAEWPLAHVELAVWPVGFMTHDVPETDLLKQNGFTERGYGASVVLMVGWRL